MHLGNWHVQILQILMAAHTGDLVLLDSTKNRKTRNFSSFIGLCSCQGARGQQNNPLKLQVFLQFTDLGERPVRVAPQRIPQFFHRKPASVGFPGKSAQRKISK